jgi:hypothetical protein
LLVKCYWQCGKHQARWADRLTTAILNSRRELQPKHYLIFDDQDPWRPRWQR